VAKCICFMNWRRSQVRGDDASALQDLWSGWTFSRSSVLSLIAATTCVSIVRWQIFRSSNLTRCVSLLGKFANIHKRYGCYGALHPYCYVGWR
jgi:hypothetical protein